MDPSAAHIKKIFSRQYLANNLPRWKIRGGFPPWNFSLFHYGMGFAISVQKGSPMELSEKMPETAKSLAERYFRDDKNNCAESVLRSILAASGIECPVEMLRMASAFGRGMGGAGCACGALIGGQMAIGVFFGREENAGYPPDICADASRLLHKRFKKQNGATCCRILHKGLPFGTEEQLSSCCQRTLEAAELAASIIREVKENGGVPEKGRIL